MRITVIEHEAEAGLGYLAGWFGPVCDVVRPYRGEEVPERAADGLVVLGGEAAAWEDERCPWLPATRELLRRSVLDGTPTLGICLGAQLMTMACGGVVERGGDGLEVGLCEVSALPEAASDRLLSGIGTAVAVQYHQDMMARLPEGAVPLMTGAPYPNQAYRLGRAPGPCSSILRPRPASSRRGPRPPPWSGRRSWSERSGRPRTSWCPPGVPWRRRSRPSSGAAEPHAVRWRRR